MTSVEQQFDDHAQTTSAPNGSHGVESSEALVPIALKTLCPTAGLDFDLYLWANTSSAAVLYRERHQPLTRDDIDQLFKADVRSLYVALNDHGRYRRYLQEEVVGEKEVPPARRYAILKELNRRVFDAALRGRRCIRRADVGKALPEAGPHGQSA